MGRSDPVRREIQEAAHLRESLSTDFSGAYMAVNNLLLQAERQPATIGTCL